MKPTIYVDADACPRVIKEILYKAANRAKINMLFVANQPLSVPNSPFIRTLQVQQGLDVADQAIVDRVSPGDLVITADIPLADAAIAKDALALDPRGELYTKENIRQRLSVRNFLHDVRSAGIQTGGPKTINNQEKQVFANKLDTYLSRIPK